MSAIASTPALPTVNGSANSVAIIHNHPIHYKELLFRALAARQLPFTVLFTARKSVERRDPEAIERPYKHRFGFMGAYEDAPALSTSRYVWTNLDRLQPKAVIISGYYDAAAWTAWAWALAHGRIRILWAESNQFDYVRRWWKEIPKRLFVGLCHMAHVYGTSNMEYVAALGMPRSRIHLKRAVLDVERFSPLAGGAEKTGPKRLLFVGRLVEAKNLRMLIRAFCRVPQEASAPRMELAIVGYGRLEQELKALASTLPNGTLVDLRGARTNDEAVDEYRQAEAFILPSTLEAWGLVALEAMCCGLPVLISARCGCARDLVNETTGWSFDPFDEDALTALLNHVSTLSREHLRERGRAARAIGATYSAASCASIVQKTLEEAHR